MTFAAYFSRHCFSRMGSPPSMSAGRYSNRSQGDSVPPSVPPSLCCVFVAHLARIPDTLKTYLAYAYQQRPLGHPGLSPVQSAGFPEARPERLEMFAVQARLSDPG